MFANLLLLSASGGAGPVAATDAAALAEGPAATVAIPPATSLAGAVAAWYGYERAVDAGVGR